jgi:hypothetical protein
VAVEDISRREIQKPEAVDDDKKKKKREDATAVLVEELKVYKGAIQELGVRERAIQAIINDRYKLQSR